MKRYLLTYSSLLMIFLSMVAMTSDVDIELKMVSFRPKPIVKGSINGKKAYFLLDTGADISLLNEDAKEKFQFLVKPDPTGRSIHGVSRGQSSIMHVQKAELMLEELKIKNKLVAYDLNHIVQSIHQKTGIQICGIIGADVMKRYGFIIDYSAKKITISKTK